MSNTQKRIEKAAKDFVRGDTCEVMDTYSAHEDTFKAGTEFGREIERERAAELVNALELYDRCGEISGLIARVALKKYKAQNEVNG